MYQVWISSHFAKQLKPLLKKYRHLKEDIIKAFDKFDKRQNQALGNDTYKVRLKSSDIPRGKNKSFRMILYIAEIDKILAPIAIYFKGEREDISQREINYNLTMVLIELESKKPSN